MIQADSYKLKEIKSRIHSQFIEKFILRPIHFSGAFLDPRQKFRLSKIGLSNDDVVAGITYIKEKMRLVGPGATTSRTHHQLLVTGVAQRTPKRAKVVVQSSRLPLDLVESESDDNDGDALDVRAAQLEMQMVQELAEYQSLRIDKVTTDETNVSDNGLLMWRKSQAARWPILAHATRSVLATSAPSAKSEHNFSEVGNHVTKKRKGLKPKTVNTLMMIRSNKDLKRKHMHT